MMLLFLCFRMPAQQKRALLQSACTPEQLTQWLLPQGAWQPFPRWGENWQGISQEVKQQQIELAEAQLGQPIPQITATTLLDFSRTGNRARNEALYFGRRNRLAQAVVAECMEGQGRFMDEIADLIWAICEESWWVIPAHYGQAGKAGLPPSGAEYVDLFAAETGALLAWTHYLLAARLDEVSPVLNQKILEAIEQRILRPALQHDDFWWMGLQGQSLNNWTPWICSNWLACVLIAEKEPEKRQAAIYKMMGCVDRFLDPYPADGGCDEGPGYWGRAGASLYEFLEMLESATQGRISLWEQPLIQNMGSYIYKAHIGEDYYINFADASAVSKPSATMVFGYGQKIGDSTMMAFGSWLAQRQELAAGQLGGNLSRKLMALQKLPAIQATQAREARLEESWFPQLQLLLCRSKGKAQEELFLAAKGGHNAESHNHNDVGSFMLYAGGKPLLIDVGVETYTRKTFSPQRYEIWTMQSQYHNLPTINGVMQAPGEDYKAQNLQYQQTTSGRSTFSLDIAPAYPDSAGLSSWVRTFTFDRRKNQVMLEESYRFERKNTPFTLSFMVAGKPLIHQDLQLILLRNQQDKRAVMAMSFPKGMKAEYEPIAIEDSRLQSVWGDTLFRILLTGSSPRLSGSHRFVYSTTHPALEDLTLNPYPAGWPVLQNPMSVSYLRRHLRREHPRLILNPRLEQQLKAKLQTEPVVQNYYAAIRLNADDILEQELLERKLIGRRLLPTSREMLYRMGVLSMVYRIEKDPRILARIDREIQAVCDFSDWNPSHFLDVAEMSMAVALALDWAGEALPPATVELAMNALIEKGLKPSYNPKVNSGWVKGHNNWNQVCHGGMMAAAITVAERAPELAAQTLERALEGMPYALKEYAPDGVYPEGSTYWGYGTGYTVLTAALLQSAFGSDFGLSAYGPFMASADFRLLSIAPSGWYYNFADCGDKRSPNGDITLAWFAAQTGNAAYFERERFLRPPAEMGKLSRFSAPGLVWLAQVADGEPADLPLAYQGGGANPIAIFQSSPETNTQFYLGAKGGRGSVNHGNMDAGSFVFELEGIRWVVDPGNQNYHALEKTGFDLWKRCQNCQRWTLLTKNNFGHSTLTFNDALHAVDGFAPIVDFRAGSQPRVTFDLSAVFGGDSSKVLRTFVKESDRSLLIEDEFEVSDSLRQITWQLMTTAEVELLPGGAILRQGGKSLRLSNLSHPAMHISVISLDPPPLLLDRRIQGLKRIEIRFPAYVFEGEREKIRLRLSGE